MIKLMRRGESAWGIGWPRLPRTVTQRQRGRAGMEQHLAACRWVCKPGPPPGGLALCVKSRGPRNLASKFLPKEC